MYQSVLQVASSFNASGYLRGMPLAHDYQTRGSPHGHNVANLKMYKAIEISRRGFEEYFRKSTHLSCDTKPTNFTLMQLYST